MVTSGDVLAGKARKYSVVINVETAEHVCRSAVCISQHRQQQVIGSYVLVAQSSRLFARLSNYVPCSVGQVHGSELIPAPEPTKT